MAIYNLYENGFLYMSELKVLLDMYKTTNNSDSSLNSNMNTAIFEKYYIITLYSIWESTTVDVMKDIYTKYPKLFQEKKFVFNYLAQVFSDRRLKKDFEKSLEDKSSYDFNQITIEYLIDNNNMWYHSLIDFFKVYGFDTDCLFSYISNNIQIKDILKNLNRSLAVNINLQNSDERDYNSLKTQSINPTKILKYEIQGYINYLVQQRNSYGHRYKKAYSSFSDTEFDDLYNFFYQLFYILNQYVDDQLTYKMVKKVKETDVTIARKNFYLYKLNINNIEFLKKKKSDETFSVEINLNDNYEFKKNTSIILFNKEKKFIDKICYFSLISVHEGKNFEHEISDDILKLHSNQTYRIILKDYQHKRTITPNEADNLEIFIKEE